MITFDITPYLTEKTAIIDARLNTLIATQEGHPSIHQLFDAARYSLLAGGKRLRPILTLATAEMLGCTDKTPLDTACALEMIHTYSLIHDDLPCMDDDDFRRGKPSLHKAYDEGLAVLTGDFLLTFAFEVVANDKHLSAEQKVTLIQILAQYSGVNGMIGGQVMDIKAEGKQLDIDALKSLHSSKTGALLKASIFCGTITAGASLKQMLTLSNFGNDFGLAFQIIDDILDVTSSEKKHGKKISSDVTNNKSTYVTLLGLEESQQAANKLIESSLNHLKSLECDTSILEAIARKIVQQKG